MRTTGRTQFGQNPSPGNRFRGRLLFACFTNDLVHNILSPRQCDASFLFLVPILLIFSSSSVLHFVFGFSVVGLIGLCFVFSVCVSCSLAVGSFFFYMRAPLAPISRRCRCISPCCMAGELSSKRCCWSRAPGDRPHPGCDAPQTKLRELGATPPPCHEGCSASVGSPSWQARTRWPSGHRSLAKTASDLKFDVDSDDDGRASAEITTMLYDHMGTFALHMSPRMETNEMANNLHANEPGSRTGVCVHMF